MALSLKDASRNNLDKNIIKQLYYVAYMKGCRLPTGLATHGHHTKVGVRGDGCTAIDTRSHANETVLPVVLRTDNPIPVYCSVYYFEVTVNVKSRAGPLAIGVCSSRSSLNEWPGMEINSYGYHSNNGAFYHGGKELTAAGPPFGEADVIGCGVNFVTNSVFFTKNGVFMGPISTGKKLPHPVYPCIALACPNCHVSANFGQHQFTFDIGQYITRERAVVISMAVDRKCNDQLAHVTMRNLVAAYMLHNGYLESACALGGWITKASQTSSSDTDSAVPERQTNGKSVKEPPDPENVHAASISDSGTLNSSSSIHLNGSVVTEGCSGTGRTLRDLFQWPEATDLLLKRRHLRDTIRTGDYISALEQLETHFQSLSTQDPSISFVLRCHHFIDLICNQQKRAVLGFHSAPVLSQTVTGLARNSSQPQVHSQEPHRIAQKRPNPSDSVESSPEAVINGACASHIQDRDSDLLRAGDACGDWLNPSTRSVRASAQSSSRVGHEHSPSSCQAPIRLRLDPTNTDLGNSNNNNNSGAGGADGSENDHSTAPLPIYPPHHLCYREGHVCRPVTPASTTLPVEASETGGSDNDIPHTPDDVALKEHRLMGSLLPGNVAEFDRMGTSIGLLESLPEQRTALGNGVTRSKYVNIIRRGKLASTTPDKPVQLAYSVGALQSNPPALNQSSTRSVSPTQPSSTPPAPASCESDSDHVVNGVGRASSVNGTLNGYPLNENNSSCSINTSKTATTRNGSLAFRARSLNGIKQNSDPVCLSALANTNWSTEDVLNLVEYGRMLRATAMQLKEKNAISPTQMQLLSGAFGLIAYQDPYSSPFRRFLDPTHRDRLADAVNSAIMVHLNQPAKPILDSALAFLERSLTEEDASGAFARNVHFSTTPGLHDRLRSDSDRAVYSAPARSEVAPGLSEVHGFGPLEFANPRRLSSYSDRLASPDSPIGVSFRHPQSAVITDISQSSFVAADRDPTNLLLPSSRRASIVTGSVYIPPSALVSLISSRIHPATANDRVPQRTGSSLRFVTSTAQHTASNPSRTTAITLSQTTDYPNSSPPPTTPLAYTSSAAAGTTNITGWSQELTTSDLPSQEPTHHSHHSAPSTAARLALASYLTDTHAPTGPELAGFFHPLLFID